MAGTRPVADKQVRVRVTEFFTFKDQAVKCTYTHAHRAGGRARTAASRHLCSTPGRTARRQTPRRHAGRGRPGTRQTQELPEHPTYIINIDTPKRRGTHELGLGSRYRQFHLVGPPRPPHCRVGWLGHVDACGEVRQVQRAPFMRMPLGHKSTGLSRLRRSYSRAIARPRSRRSCSSA